MLQYTTSSVKLAAMYLLVSPHIRDFKYCLLVLVGVNLHDKEYAVLIICNVLVRVNLHDKGSAMFLLESNSVIRDLQCNFLQHSC